MRNLEFFRNVSIGNYVGVDSAVHRLSPAAKYLWLIVVVAASSASGSVAVVAAAAALTAAFVALSRVRFGFLLRGFLPVLPLLGLAALLQLLVSWPNDDSAVLLSLGPLSATLREVVAVSLMAARFFTIMLAIGLFTSVTSEGDTARGIEDVLSPLARLGFPARDLSLAVAVAFRFIPIVAGELEAIVKAQAARGADFGSGRGGLVRKVRAYLPLLVPVTIRALERAQALGEAMEARCYGPQARTRYMEASRGWVDALAKAGALTAGLGFAAASFALK